MFKLQSFVVYFKFKPKISVISNRIKCQHVFFLKQMPKLMFIIKHHLHKTIGRTGSKGHIILAYFLQSFRNFEAL